MAEIDTFLEQIRQHIKNEMGFDPEQSVHDDEADDKSLNIMIDVLGPAEFFQLGLDAMALNLMLSKMGFNDANSWPRLFRLMIYQLADMVWVANGEGLPVNQVNGLPWREEIMRLFDKFMEANSHTKLSRFEHARRANT